MNKLTFIKYVEPVIRRNGYARKRALYKCDCGNLYEADFSGVNTRHTTQCFKCSRIASAEKRTKHALIKHPLYSKWQDMKKRCYNTKVDRFKNYGARGIVVCSEWKNDFKKFYDWCIEKGWNESLQIDRINNDGNYTPENCKLSTSIEQGFNKQNTFYVTVNGEKYSLAKLLYENNQSNKYCAIWHGLKKGKLIEHYIEKYDLKLM